MLETSCPTLALAFCSPTAFDDPTLRDSGREPLVLRFPIRLPGRDLQYAYCAAPDILHWEERATEWSELPDQIRVKVVICTVEDRSVISSVILQGQSKMVTFGGDYPQDLLPAPIARYLETVY